MADEFRLWPFYISLKTDLIAWTAFAISAASGAWQVGEALRGARVSVTPPAQIVLFFEKTRTDEGPIDVLRINAPITVLNAAGKDYSAVVENARVKMTIDGAVYRQRAQTLESFENEEGGAMKRIWRGPWAPFLVPGAGAISQETSFATYPRERCGAFSSDAEFERCERRYGDSFLTLAGFTNRARRARDSNTPIRFEFEVATAEGKRSVRGCSVDVRTIPLRDFETKGGTVVECWSSGAGAR